MEQRREVQVDEPDRRRRDRDRVAVPDDADLQAAATRSTRTSSGSSSTTRRSSRSARCWRSPSGGSSRRRTGSRARSGPSTPPKCRPAEPLDDRCHESFPDLSAQPQVGHHLGDVVLRPVRGHHAFEGCVEQLATAIRLGVFPFGSALPPERELAERMGVSRATLREAIAGAAQAGMVRTTRGRGGGTVVSYRPATPALGRLAGHRRASRASCSTRWSTGGSSSRAPATWPRPATLTRQRASCCSRTALAEVDQAEDPAAHRQADSRLHLAIASVTASPMTIEAVTEVQASLHDMLQAIPVLEVNIEHSSRQHRAIVDGDPRRRTRPRPGGRWSSTATTRPRCCADCSAETQRRQRTRMPRNDRHLTARPAHRSDRVRRDRHRRRRLHRHAGTAAGQAPARALLPRHRGRARHRGLQLPARRRRRHEHRGRLRDHVVGPRVRRHGVRPRHRHAPAAHPPAGDGDGPVRPGLARPRAGAAVAALDPQAPDGPGRRARLRRLRRHRARVHRLRGHLRGGPRPRLPRT